MALRLQDRSLTQIFWGRQKRIHGNTIKAEIRVIEPGIGSVGAVGSVSVTPDATTIYTIFVEGPGGKDCDSAVVEVSDVHVPTAEIGADPLEIKRRHSSTLSWSAKNAESCMIEPGIGSVAPSGSLAVSPDESTTYTLTATSPAGTALDSVTISVEAPSIVLEITSPEGNETILQSEVMVEGTAINLSDLETGVTVNGMVALVHEGRFAANHVPLEEGENTITATATDTEGHVVEESITVDVEPAVDYVRISPDSVSGISPFETILRVESSLPFSESSISYTGPGQVLYPESTAEEYKVRATEGGIYSFAVEVVDDSGDVHGNTVSLLVMDEAALDVLLRARWDSMKSALGEQDIEAALGFFTQDNKDLYEEIYNSLYEKLPAIVEDMQDIQLVCFNGEVGKYRIRRNRVCKGETYPITYNIYFIRDVDGLWKIFRY